MRFIPFPAACIGAALVLSACGPTAPVTGSTRSQAIATAYSYTQVTWMPEARHALHGPDAKGIAVQTPDASLGDGHGWWKAGVQAKGVPYQWGGFDTPQQFLTKLQQGKAAGDVSTEAKRQLGDAGTSSQACGIDCSGFVSRCWGLPRPYSTAEIPKICDRLKSTDELLPGDAMLNDRHVLIFARWADASQTDGYFYEAGPKPVWRVNAAGIPIQSLKDRGYAPWRYRGLKDG